MHVYCVPISFWHDYVFCCNISCTDEAAPGWTIPVGGGLLRTEASKQMVIGKLFVNNVKLKCCSFYLHSNIFYAFLICVYCN